MVNDTGAVVNFGWSEQARKVLFCSSRTMNAPDQLFHGLEPVCIRAERKNFNQVP